MRASLITQLKKRRLELGLKQKDMMTRVGISRQQYQFLESKGNPRLDTLELIAEGLNSRLMLIPKEKLFEINALLEGETTALSQRKKDLSDDPWQGLLEDDQ